MQKKNSLNFLGNSNIKVQVSSKDFCRLCFEKVTHPLHIYPKYCERGFHPISPIYKCAHDPCHNCSPGTGLDRTISRYILKKGKQFTYTWLHTIINVIILALLCNGYYSMDHAKRVLCKTIEVAIDVAVQLFCKDNFVERHIVYMQLQPPNNFVI